MNVNHELNLDTIQLNLLNHNKYTHPNVNFQPSNVPEKQISHNILNDPFSQKMNNKSNNQNSIGKANHPQKEFVAVDPFLSNNPYGTFIALLIVLICLRIILYNDFFEN